MTQELCVSNNLLFILRALFHNSHQRQAGTFFAKYRLCEPAANAERVEPIALQTSQPNGNRSRLKRQLAVDNLTSQEVVGAVGAAPELQ